MKIKKEDSDKRQREVSAIKKECEKILIKYDGFKKREDEVSKKETDNMKQ